METNTQIPGESVQNPNPNIIVNNPTPKKVGPIIAIMVILLVLVMAAIYMFASRLNKQPATNNTGYNSNLEFTAQQPVAPVTNSSDDISSIETDLNSSTNGLDGQNF